MKLKALTLICVSLLCATMMSGCLYSKVKLPYDLNVSETRMGDKVGRATAQSVLWLVAWGDASTAAAAKDGGMTTVNHLDREQTIIVFGLYSESTTIAYGE